MKPLYVANWIDSTGKIGKVAYWGHNREVEAMVTPDGMSGICAFGETVRNPLDVAKFLEAADAWVKENA